MMIVPRYSHKSIYLLTIIAITHGMSIGRNGEGKVRKTDDSSKDESKVDDIDAIKPLSETGENIWNKMFAKSGHWNTSLLLPASVYDFQTGEISYYNGDLNSSSTDHEPVTEYVLKGPDNLDTSGEDRPRRYSAKYAKNEAPEGEVSHNGQYDVLEESKAPSEERETIVEKTEDHEPLKKDQNEHYEVYEQQKKDDGKSGGGGLVAAATGHGGGGGGKGGNKKHSEGKGEEHHTDHHASKGSKGTKDYKGEHHHHKGEKGHHDKETHKGEYSDTKGSKKEHKEGGGHFEAGVHGEKGHKDAKHSDKEEYKKGHSTRGGHVVHKKDEYEKKHEFYDEHHEGGEGEKHGEYHEEHHAKSGGHKKGGHKHGGASGHHKGKKGHYDKGHKYHEEKGHKKAGGHEKKHDHDEKYGKKEGHSNWKKFEYDNGGGKGGGGGGGGGHGHKGAGDGSHGHSRAVIYHHVPKQAQVKEVPHYSDSRKQEEISHLHQIALADSRKQDEISHLHQIALADSAAAENARPPIPATELRPPPVIPPKISVSQFRFPPIATR